MELKGCFPCWASVLSAIMLCCVRNGSNAGLVSRTNPCLEYFTCISPVSIATTRIITALFSFNFYRFADGDFLLDICQELSEIGYCGNLLRRCRIEEWQQAAYFQNSDVELAQWVCFNKDKFQAQADCWDDPFLGEMSSCTGLEQFLQPTECLTDKMQELGSCSQQAKELFQNLLFAAHST